MIFLNSVSPSYHITVCSEGPKLHLGARDGLSFVSKANRTPHWMHTPCKVLNECIAGRGPTLIGSRFSFHQVWLECLDPEKAVMSTPNTTLILKDPLDAAG